MALTQLLINQSINQYTLKINKREKVKLLLFPQQLLLSLCIYSPVLNLTWHCNVPVEPWIEFLLVLSPQIILTTSLLDCWSKLIHSQFTHPPSKFYLPCYSQGCVSHFAVVHCNCANLQYCENNGRLSWISSYYLMVVHVGFPWWLLLLGASPKTSLLIWTKLQTCFFHMLWHWQLVMV